MFSRPKQHKWSEWIVTERGSIVFISNSEVKTGTYLMQDRYCLKCGKTEIDRQITGEFIHSVHRLIPTTGRLTPKHDKVS